MRTLFLLPLLFAYSPSAFGQPTPQGVSEVGLGSGRIVSQLVHSDTQFERLSSHSAFQEAVRVESGNRVTAAPGYVLFATEADRSGVATCARQSVRCYNLQRTQQGFVLVAEIDD